MRTITLESQQKRNQQNRKKSLAAVRAVDRDFYAGKREFDRPRKNPAKQRTLQRMAGN